MFLYILWECWCSLIGAVVANLSRCLRRCQALGNIGNILDNLEVWLEMIEIKPAGIKHVRMRYVYQFLGFLRAKTPLILWRWSCNLELENQILSMHWMSICKFAERQYFLRRKGHRVSLMIRWSGLRQSQWLRIHIDWSIRQILLLQIRITLNDYHHNV